eukprot:5369067-Karenia_brevis.AAC.1
MITTSDVISFNSAISACERGDEQVGGSIGFDVLSFNAAISACEQSGVQQSSATPKRTRSASSVGM